MGRNTARLLVLGVAGLMLNGCPTAELGKFIVENGYTDPKPPSNLLEPGTIVFRKSASPLVYGIACTAKSAFGADLDTAIKSADGANTALVSSMKGKFKLDVGYQDVVKANVGATYVKDITLDLSEVHLLALPANEVFDRVSKRSEGCKKAIEFYAKQGQPLTLVVEVLKANALYTISFETSFSTEAKVQIEAVQGLAAQLGADATTATRSTVKGTGLFWGVRDDASLATVKAGDSAATKGGPAVRLIPPTSVTLDPTPPQF